MNEIYVADLATDSWLNMWLMGFIPVLFTQTIMCLMPFPVQRDMAKFAHVNM